LTEVNELFLRAACSLLGITTRLSRSSAHALCTDRNLRLIQLCELMGASRYLVGPTARVYLDEAAFRAHGIDVIWKSYAGYPIYSQLYEGPFVSAVSILDLLLNQGPEQSRTLLRATPQ
jgi:hypothetical protein